MCRLHGLPRALRMGGGRTKGAASRWWLSQLGLDVFQSLRVQDVLAKQVRMLLLELLGTEC